MQQQSTSTLVLIPGMGNNERLWSAQIELLAPDIDVVVPDYRGATSLPEMSAAVVQQLPPGQVSLLGFSLGAYIALDIVARDPQRVERLALISASPFADTEKIAEQRRHLIVAAERDYEALLDSMGEFIVFADGENAQHTREVLGSMGRELGIEEFCRQQVATMNRKDCTAMLSDIACPCSILCGANDAVTPLSGNQYLADHIQDASIQILQQCGHIVPLERPEETAAFIEEFLGKR
jgi:pimeloyl-ACP methyl ester carboxylesterase